MLCPPYPFSTRFLINRRSPDSANIIVQVIVGGDALSLMPRCGGKRQCCQITALPRQRVGLGSMVVIAPVHALMHDQAAALHAAGVSAALSNSAHLMQQTSLVKRHLMQGEITLVHGRA